MLAVSKPNRTSSFVCDNDNLMERIPLNDQLEQLSLWATGPGIHACITSNIDSAAGDPELSKRLLTFVSLLEPELPLGGGLFSFILFLHPVPWTTCLLFFFLATQQHLYFNGVDMNYAQ